MKKKKLKKIVVLPFFVTTKFTKFKIILFLNRYQKKFEQILKDIV
jgi:hypothetical protein